MFNSNPISRKVASLISLDLHKDLLDEEGFPRADLDFGKLQEYRNLKRKQNGRY